MRRLLNPIGEKKPPQTIRPGGGFISIHSWSLALDTAPRQELTGYVARADDR